MIARQQRARAREGPGVVQWRGVAWRGVQWAWVVVRANACTRHGRKEGQPTPTPTMDLGLDLDLHALCSAVIWIRLRRCLRSGWLATPTRSRLPDGEMLHFCFHSHLPLATHHSLPTCQSNAMSQDEGAAECMHVPGQTEVVSWNEGR
jgi:hypothetical protein